MKLLTVLSEMVATAVPAGSDGLWTVTKRNGHREKDGSLVVGEHTYLSRVTEATLHTAGDTVNPPGECVMTDARSELVTHLEAVRHATGRVLVTGLGLGCVVRGILTKASVTELVVLERSRSVLRLVRPFMPDDRRLRIIECEALEWVLDHANERWDVVWHDLWTDRDRGEPHLAVTHQALFMALEGRTRWQGAWSFPRYVAKLFERFPRRRPVDPDVILDVLTAPRAIGAAS